MAAAALPYADAKPMMGSATFSESGEVMIKEEKSLTISTGSDVGKDTNERHKHEKTGGCAWFVWVFVIFIIVLLIIMAIFWWCQPDCVTNDCADGGKEIDPCYAAGYAFIIAFVLVLILVAAYACVC